MDVWVVSTLLFSTCSDRELGPSLSNLGCRTDRSRLESLDSTPPAEKTLWP